MLWHFYARKGIAYLPTVARTEAGYYQDVDPVASIPISETEALCRAVREVIARGNPVVSTPTRANMPRPVVLKYAGVNTWKAFARGTSIWSIYEENGAYKIIGY